jgi:hypothetical protein
MGVAVTVLAATWWSAVQAGVDPVDDETLVDALIEAAAAEELPLDEHCVRGVVEGSGVLGLDDELARWMLMELLDAAGEEPPGTDLIVSGSSVRIVEHGGFLVVPYPVVFDIDALRRQLLACVTGPADTELVEQVATLFAGAGFGQVFDLNCVERVLTTFSDDTLELFLEDQPPTTVAVDAEVIEGVLSQIQPDLSRLLVCSHGQPTASTEP